MRQVCSGPPFALCLEDSTDAWVEIIFKLLESNDPDVDAYLQAASITLREASQYTYWTDTLPDAIRSLNIDGREDHYESTSSLIADHAVSLHQHVDGLFRMNPMIAAIRERYCHYGHISSLFSDVLLDNQDPKSIATNVEDTVDGILTSLRHKGEAERKSEKKTTTESIARLFEEEKDKLKAWKSRHGDIPERDTRDEQLTGQDLRSLDDVLHRWLQDIVEAQQGEPGDRKESEDPVSRDFSEVLDRFRLVVRSLPGMPQESQAQKETRTQTQASGSGKGKERDLSTLLGTEEPEQWYTQ